MSVIDHRLLQDFATQLEHADTVLIGSGAGLTAAAGINYLDRKKFAEIFPGWVRKGFHCQYELMGYPFWSQREMWGYYKVHLEYVYFAQGENPLYRLLYEQVKDKDYFVMTSNVDGLFYKSGFDRMRFYSPQGDYGKIQCAKPCSQQVWDVLPFLERMEPYFDPVAQVLTSDKGVPQCPNCGGSMFIHARVDNSFIDSIHEAEALRLMDWLRNMTYRQLLVLDLGSGFNTPTVIRRPMEQVTREIPHSTLVRVNIDHAEVPPDLAGRSIAIKGDIRAYLEGLEACRT